MSTSDGDSSSSKMSSEEFVPIRVCTLRGDQKIPFDAFVHVAGKHILYCRHGDSFEGLRLNRLKAKRLQTMYIRSDDQAAYAKYLLENLEIAYDDSRPTPLDIRAQIIHGIQQDAAEKYIENPEGEFDYHKARDSVKRFTDYLKKAPDTAYAILRMENIDQSITHHGVTVATLSLLMTLEGRLRTTTPLHLMALGCLLHDIEHCYNGIDMSRPLTTLTASELQSYKEHPHTGRNRFVRAKFADPIVLNIIAQHEEHIDGSGFPNHLKEIDVHPLVVVAATANAYDRLVCFEQLSPREAFKSMQRDSMGAFPLGYIMTLQAILKRMKMT
jgi:HD-GYP domain-containing protein (c-di-GMP phosphodiesterase class II)